jgi:small-conductance mechanosensitive channel
MSIEESLQFIANAFAKQVIFFQRFHVQIQFIAIIGAIGSAWFGARWAQSRLIKLFPHVLDQATWSQQKVSWRHYASVAVYYLLTPILSLILLAFVSQLLLLQHWRVGLLKVAIDLLWVYLAYRFLLFLLYALFPKEVVRPYHLRLFVPIFVLYALGTVLSLSTNLMQLAQVVPVPLFGSPLTLGHLFVLTVGLYFWIVIVFFLESLFVWILTQGIHIETGPAQATSILLRYALLGLGTVLILGYVGVRGTAFAAITGGLSVGIGFGLQQVVSNFISGILLLFEGALRPGDIISVEGEASEVKRMGMRATTVRVLRDNSEKIIPNQLFFTKEVTTYTGSDRLTARTIQVKAKSDTDPQLVIDLLLQIAAQYPKVLSEPAPIVSLIGFSDSGLTFELKFWLADPRYNEQATSDISFEIYRIFAEHQIQLL